MSFLIGWFCVMLFVSSHCWKNSSTLMVCLGNSAILPVNRSKIGHSYMKHLHTCLGKISFLFFFSPANKNSSCRSFDMGTITGKFGLILSLLWDLIKIHQSSLCIRNEKFQILFENTCTGKRCCTVFH